MHNSILARLLQRIESKTTWGKNELKFLLLEIIAEVYPELGDSPANKKTPPAHYFGRRG